MVASLKSLTAAQTIRINSRLGRWPMQLERRHEQEASTLYWTCHALLTYSLHCLMIVRTKRNGAQWRIAAFQDRNVIET